MNTLETYFEKKARKERQDELKAIKLAKEILLLCIDLHQVLPYAVNAQFTGHVEWLEIYILDPESLEHVYEIKHFSLKGPCLDLKRLRKLKTSLQTAVNTKCLPEELEVA